MSIDPQRTKRIFKKLMRVAPELQKTLESAQSKVQGFMDLSLDIIERKGDYLRIALSHYFKHPSGDMIPDPDMEIAVFIGDEVAEALTYQDAIFYEAAYVKDGEPPDLAIQTRMNVFLEQWLDNLAEQGHVLPRGQ